MTKSDRIAKKIQERDGLDCFLCGKTHTSLARMSVGFVATEQTIEQAHLACTGCNKRRNNRPLGAYIRQRLKEAREEVLYIETSFDPANKSSRVTHDVWQALRRPIKVYQSELEEEVAESPVLAQDIQDMPWKDLLSPSMDMHTFESLNKEPASEHEAELIVALGELIRCRANPDSDPTFVRFYAEPGSKKLSLSCQTTGHVIPCKWEDQDQYERK